jgi:hypothetical protein
VHVPKLGGGQFTSDSINKTGCLIVISAGQQKIKTSRLDKPLRHPAFVDERPLHCYIFKITYTITTTLN